jgi:ribulose-5-phosphate 4-epimerase/fuculose-1-phosphate aldolase
MKVYEELKKLGKLISNYVVGIEGNISKKENNLIYIKSSGTQIKNLNKDDIVCYDFSKQQIDNFTKKGSMELDFHIFLLGKENVTFVCHTHPTNTLKILCSEYSKEFSEKRLFPDQVIFNGKKSCLVPYATPGNDLFEKIKYCVNNFEETEGIFPKLILLENHGVIVCGNSIDECVTITEICEKSAEIYLGCLNINSKKFLSDNEILKLLNDENEKYRKNIL